MAGTHADVYGLTPPSDSDGPIRLLNCVVESNGILAAEVDSQSEDAMGCNIKCNYMQGEETFEHVFEVTIPAKFTGRVGRFNTFGGKAGNYSGEVGTCKKNDARGAESAGLNSTADARNSVPV